MTRHGSHTESRMRENCTYGSMRGRAYPITRGVPLYSTPFSVPNCPVGNRINYAADGGTTCERIESPVGNRTNYADSDCTNAARRNCADAVCTIPSSPLRSRRVLVQQPAGNRQSNQDGSGTPVLCRLCLSGTSEPFNFLFLCLDSAIKC